MSSAAPCRAVRLQVGHWLLFGAEEPGMGEQVQFGLGVFEHRELWLLQRHHIAARSCTRQGRADVQRFFLTRAQLARR